MAAKHYVVEWVFVVDHPELRDRSLPKVPRHTRILYQAAVGTMRRARERFEEFTSGQHDGPAQYIGRAAIIERDKLGRSKIVRATQRQRDNGHARRIGDAPPSWGSAPELKAERQDEESYRDYLAALASARDKEEQAERAATTLEQPPRGQLFTVEQEGFALTAPRGEFGGGSTKSQGTQAELVGVSRKVDTATMAAIVERERAERAARKGSAASSAASDDSGAVLAPAQHEPPPTAPSVPEPGVGQARLEFVDVATGEPRSPEAPGTAASGQIVAELDGAAVVVDPEDVIGRGTDPDPRRRRYSFDVESPADYPAQARRKKAQRHKRVPPPRPPRSAGATFKAPAAAARMFYAANAAFFDNVPDPIDGLREWADGIELRVSKHRSKRLGKTPSGARIFAASRGQGQIEAALRFLFGKAKGRRWDAVSWRELDALEAALLPHFEHAPGAARGIVWRPSVAAIAVEDLERMPPDKLAQLRDYESHREIKAALEELRDAYRRTRACIPPPLRGTVLHRIAQWSRWEKAPSRIPPYACEPDMGTGGYLCNYPAVAGELRALRRACEVAYDPDWALPEARAGAPGFPDLSGGEHDTEPRPAPAIVAVAPAQTRTPKRTQKTKRASRPAPKKAARALPSQTPSTTPSVPAAPSVTKKPAPSTKSKALPSAAEVEECASVLGRHGAEVRRRRKRERLPPEERAALLDEALDLAIMR